MIDGLLFPDRRPSPALGELAKVQQPVSVELVDDAGKLQLRNRYDFASLAHLEGYWSLFDDGVLVGGGSLGQLSAGPGQTETVIAGPLPLWRAEAVLDVSLRSRAPSLWAPAGHEVAWAQFVLPARARGKQGNAEPDGQVFPLSQASTASFSASERAVSIEENAEGTVISADGSRVRFVGGWLVSWEVEGTELVDHAARLELLASPDRQ